MPDLEKTVHGLESLWKCVSPVVHDCANCPYRENHVECKRRVISDALSLLKAQQPKVMTLEELKNKKEEPIYFESHGTYMGKDCFWILPALFTPTGLMRYLHPLGSHYSELGLYSYGKNWRCWTSKPTEEQRRAVEWG